MQKIEKTPTVITLGTINTDIVALKTESVTLNATSNAFTRKALALIADMITIYPTLNGAKEYHEFNGMFSELSTVKDSVSENSIKIIQGVRGLLNITEAEMKKAMYDILVKVSTSDRVLLKHYDNIIKSVDSISKNKKFVDGYNFVATVDNILTVDMDKNIEILMPKATVGQLYPTATQVEEMKPTAKKTISYGREVKKIGSKIGGMLKQYEKQEVNETDFVQYLKDNIADVVKAYMDEKNNNVNNKPKTKIALEEENKKLLAELEALKNTKKPTKKAA